MVAKAKNDRFERRVRAIAAGPQETKWGYHQALPFSVIPSGLASASYFWVFNPFGSLFRADSAFVRSRSEVQGEEFVLRGLKLQGIIANNLDRVWLGRISLISTDQLITESDQGIGSGLTVGVPGIFDDEGLQLATQAKFDMQKVKVLHSRRMTKENTDNGSVWRINEWWGTNQKKMAREQESVGSGVSETVGYLKNRQYYWVLEIHTPSHLPNWTTDMGAELASYVYWKDP